MQIMTEMLHYIFTLYSEKIDIYDKTDCYDFNMYSRPERGKHRGQEILSAAVVRDHNDLR